MKRIQFFRPGRFKAMSGKTLEFSEEQLKDAASVYDPAVYTAKIVAGHPKTDDPNYGLVGKIEFADGHLYADPSDVEPAFADLVKAKRFDAVSASWWTPEAPNNPKPGHYYLKHIGFLGAVPPALKGLKSPSVEFGEGEEEGQVVCFAELERWDVLTLSGLLRNLREFFIGKYGQDEADKVLPTFDIDQIQQAAYRPDPDDEPAPTPASFAEATGATMTEEEKAAAAKAEAEAKAKADAEAKAKKEADDKAAAEAKAKLEEEAKALAEKKAEVESREAKVNEAELAQYAEDLIKDGKLLPAEKAGLVEFAMTLDKTETVEFSEGDGTTKAPKTRLDWLKNFLSSRPAVVSFSEAAGGAAHKPEDIAEFAAPSGMTVTPESQAVYKQAKEYQKTHNCDIQTAYTAVSSQKG